VLCFVFLAYLVNFETQSFDAQRHSPGFQMSQRTQENQKDQKNGGQLARSAQRSGKLEEEFSVSLRPYFGGNRFIRHN
jgi:hypothetical protein